MSGLTMSARSSRSGLHCSLFDRNVPHSGIVGSPPRCPPSQTAVRVLSLCLTACQSLAICSGFSPPQGRRGGGPKGQSHVSWPTRPLPGCPASTPTHTRAHTHVHTHTHTRTHAAARYFRKALKGPSAHASRGAAARLPPSAGRRTRRTRRHRRRCRRSLRACA